MKALITGGAGFLGFHLADFLSRRNDHITIVDDFSRGVSDTAFLSLTRRSNVSAVEEDMTSQYFLKKLPNDYAFIFHFAAMVGVGNVVAKPYEVLHRNIASLFNILELAKAQRSLKRFVFASSSEVYAGTLQHFGLSFPTPESTPLTIPDVTSPRSTYMISKLFGEALCHHAGIPFTIVRPHNIYGPRMGLSHVIPELLQKVYCAGPDESLEVFSPEHKRAFCYVEDAIRMIVAAAESPSAVNETLNIGNSSSEITMRELAQMILGVVGKNFPIREMLVTAGSPPRRCPDMTRAIELTGNTSWIGLEEGIRKTFEWYRQHVFAGREVCAK